MCCEVKVDHNYVLLFSFKCAENKREKKPPPQNNYYTLGVYLVMVGEIKNRMAQ